MGRTLLTILGVILAIWLVFSMLGWLFSLLKLFVIVGMIAAVIYLVVTLVAKSSKGR
jgi:L-asparagine transporter-like permease